MEFLAKYVRHDLEPGRYIVPEPGAEPVWNLHEGHPITARDIVQGNI